MTADLDALRARTRALCNRFPDEYWRETDRDRRYPQEFVDALTGAGLLAALIPAGYGGLGLGLTEASVILEEINKSGGHSAACHAQMYTMGALLRHGSDHLRDAYLPPIATGELRLWGNVNYKLDPLPAVVATFEVAAVVLALLASRMKWRRPRPA